MIIIVCMAVIAYKTALAAAHKHESCSLAISPPVTRYTIRSNQFGKSSVPCA
jgi:hypothetical protein